MDTIPNGKTVPVRRRGRKVANAWAGSGPDKSRSTGIHGECIGLLSTTKKSGSYTIQVSFSSGVERRMFSLEDDGAIGKSGPSEHLIRVPKERSWKCSHGGKLCLSAGDNTTLVPPRVDGHRLQFGFLPGGS